MIVSDNIPGVAGIGRVKATQLLLDYQNLESIYEHLEEIPEKIAQKLIEDKEMAFLSRQLVTLMTDAPVKLDLESMSISNLDVLKLQQKIERARILQSTATDSQEHASE